jgi:hypothetical protein
MIKLKSVRLANLNISSSFLFLIYIFASCNTNIYRDIPDDYIPLLEQSFEKARANRANIEASILQASKEEKEAVAYLISYMPERDLQELNKDYILENVRYALKAKQEFLWCANLPEEIFFNEVLPHSSINETRDRWRKEFYEIFTPLVKDCKDIYEAIDSINLNIIEVLGVEYNTARLKADQSCFESMEIGMASCTGLSILLVNAFRAVGIPARFAGTPMWTNMRGNHSWVEVWIDGNWYFTEYYPDALNKSWFLADAGRADIEDPQHWIYAVSYKPTDLFFPLKWLENNDYVYAENVTQRYIDLHRQQITNSSLTEDEIFLNVVLYESDYEDDGNNRISKRVDVLLDDSTVDFGYTPGPRDDLNRFLVLKLKKETDYEFAVEGNNGEMRFVDYNTGVDCGEILKLFMN